MPVRAGVLVLNNQKHSVPAFLLCCLLATTVLKAEDNFSLDSRPLAPKSGPRGATLFHEMPSAETGIVTENKYDDPRMWGDRFRTFLYGSIGTGVAIADYDNDGRPDILVVSKVERHRLFRNLGNWHFEDVTPKSGVAVLLAGEWEQGATWIDVNNDGRLDLYICRSGAPNLLYVNQGNGIFKEEAAARGLAVNDDSVMASFGDYDRDGWLDVYIVTNTLDTNNAAGRPDLLFHNNGDGTFTDVTIKAGIGSYPFQGHAAMWWDYDNDGWPDLYVANDFSPPDLIYHNERSGVFSLLQGSTAVPHVPNTSMGADIGDLNNDGRIDLLVADMAPTTHEKEYRTVADPRIKVNDPFVDPMEIIQLPRNALFLNTGTGFCLEAAELTGLARSDWTWSVRCEDLDCDGWTDVHFTNGMNREQHNFDLAQSVANANSFQEQVQRMKRSPVLAETNLAFRNLGNLKFQEVGASWGLNQNGVSFGAAFGDLDGDGDLDLVQTNYQAGVTVWRNDADSGHRVVFNLRGHTSNSFGVGAVVRIETAAGVQVRQLALARGYMSGSEPMFHFGLREQTHIERAVITWPSGKEQILTNLDADHSYTITEPHTSPEPVQPSVPKPPLQFNEVSRFAGLSHLIREPRLDETSIQPLSPRTFNRVGPAVAVGDLNGDGTDDICLGGTTMDPAKVLIADRQGGYQESNALAALGQTTINDGPVLIFDADSDDRNDILITAGGIAPPVGDPAYQPRLLLNRADGTFTPAPVEALPPFLQPVGAAAAADFDHDGQLDAFLGGRVHRGEYPLAPRSALLLNRGGRFEDVTDAVAPDLRNVGNVTSCLWTDVNGDGWIDLLVASEWGRIEYFENRQGKHFEKRTEQVGFASAGTGLWSSLCSADFNDDGRPDYVAGNLGLNTPYQASEKSPMLLYRGRFLDREKPASIEAYYESDRLFPRSPRTELGSVFPGVLRRYRDMNGYARATLPEILGQNALGEAKRFVVTQLQSGVFLSQPNGTYFFSPLPRIAQIAPMQGMVAGDFDGDSHADILAVQNSETYNQTAGRFDGGIGQYLRGDGHGNFLPNEAAKNGFIVPGSARALAIVNFDGDAWPDFFVTRNRSPSLAWQNHGISGNKTLEVRLTGRPGNRNSIGGRVTVQLTDETSQTSEVTAGGGAISQSTSHLYFGYPASNPPVKLKICWPSGKQSEVALVDVPARLNIREEEVP
jgi:enediyne biosynthesis protein E4